MPYICKIYSDKDVEKIFSEIEKKVKDVKAMFRENSAKGKQFKLID